MITGRTISRWCKKAVLGLAGYAFVQVAWCDLAIAQRIDTGPRTRFGAGSTVWTGLYLESWKEDQPGPLGERLTQSSAYVLVLTPLSSKMHLEVSSGWASTDRASNRLSALGDTKAEVSFRVKPNFVLLAGTNLPTGTTGLSVEQVSLAFGVGDRLKGYRTNQFGQGFDVNFGAVYAFRTGRVAWGLGAGYLVKGKYPFFADQEDYDPGDQVTLTAGADLGSSLHRMRTNLVVNVFGEDALGDDPVFEFGTRFRLDGVYRYEGNPVASQLRARVILQRDSQVLDSIAQSRSESTENRGTEFYFDGLVEYPSRAKLRVHGLLGGRVFGEDFQGAGDGYRFDLGTGGRYAFSRAIWLSARGRYSWGRLDRLESSGSVFSSDLTGYAVEIGLQVFPRR